MCLMFLHMIASKCWSKQPCMRMTILVGYSHADLTLTAKGAKFDGACTQSRDHEDKFIMKNKIGLLNYSTNSKGRGCGRRKPTRGRHSGYQACTNNGGQHQSLK